MSSFILNILRCLPIFLFFSRPPSVDRSSKPSDHFTSSGALTGNKHGLRGVSIPGEIVVKFLNIALPNTSRNIETCGILCGRMVCAFVCVFLSVQLTLFLSSVRTLSWSVTLSSLSRRVLPTHARLQRKKLSLIIRITTILSLSAGSMSVPSSLIVIATPFFFQTHPSQTAFLSSVDLHTHCSYQLMLPEAVAIVCAPQYQEYVSCCHGNLVITFFSPQNGVFPLDWRRTRCCLQMPPIWFSPASEGTTALWCKPSVVCFYLIFNLFFISFHRRVHMLSWVRVRQLQLLIYAINTLCDVDVCVQHISQNSLLCLLFVL